MFHAWSPKDQTLYNLGAGGCLRLRLVSDDGELSLASLAGSITQYIEENPEEIAATIAPLGMMFVTPGQARPDWLGGFLHGFLAGRGLSTRKAKILPTWEEIDIDTVLPRVLDIIKEANGIGLQGD